MDCINSNLTFTSKYKPIENARVACRRITLYSPTKRQLVVDNLRLTSQEAMEFFENYRYFGDDFSLANGGEITNVLEKYMVCSDKLNQNRNISGNRLGIRSAQKLLNFVQNSHIGNCGEYAESIALILNMNGIKNAYFTTIKAGEKNIKHEVCIFNADGSPFNGKVINNKTIIVDAWSGIVDFANNALKSIKNTCSNYFYFNKDCQLSINERQIAAFDLSEKDLNTLRKQFPNFRI